MRHGFGSRAVKVELVGRVVGVHDGDTLTVLVSQKQIKVRLTEIDAPQRTRPFYSRSAEPLAEFCAGKNPRVVEKGKDKYGSTLGRVYYAGVDETAEQVRRGMAWDFDRCITDGGLCPLQDEARAARRGLWADPNPALPWEYRQWTR